ncbi:MAG: thioredoxin domain-containing protein, partial [Candidatus Methanosuratincola sp.]
FASNLPPGSQIKVSGYEESQVKGFKKGSFSVNTGRGSAEVPFLISEDNKYIVLGDAVDLTTFQESPIKGMKQGKIFIGRQPYPILISGDGKYLVAGELLDSTVNPLKEVMSKISLNNVPVKGNAGAKVAVVEYSDFQCPFCKKGSEILPKLLDEYKGKIKVVYKQFPLPSHNWAKQASIASLCAYEQGNDHFWKYHDLLFQNQHEINADNANDKFTEFAKKLGLNEKKFEACLTSPETEKRLNEEMNEAQSLGVNSTPTFVVNGQVVRGASYEGIKAAIDSALSGEL